MGAETVEMLIRRCRDSSTLLAMGAVSALVAQLKQKGHRVVGAGILFASGRPLPDLAATLQVLVRASEHRSLHVTKVKEREVWDRGTMVFRPPAVDLQQRIAGLGKSLGPPWRQDEELASLAAWIALTESK